MRRAVTPPGAPWTPRRVIDPPRSPRRSVAIPSARRVLLDHEVPEFPIQRFSHQVDMSATAVLSAVAFARASVTANLTATTAPSGGTYPRANVAPNMAGAANLTALARVLAIANLTASGELSALVRVAALGELSAEAVLTAESYIAVPVLADLAAAGVLSAAVIASVALPASLGAAAVLTAAVEAIGGSFELEVDLEASTALTAQAWQIASVPAPLAASVVLSAESSFRYLREAAFEPTAVLSAEVFARFSRTASISAGAALSAVAVPNSVPMGVDKSGTQTFSTTGVWTKITSWTARSGYPDTVINGANDGIVIRSGTYDLAGRFTIESSRSFTKIRIMKNGTTELVSFDCGSTAAAVVNAFVGMVQLSDSDVLTLEGQVTATRTVQAGSTNTFLTADLTPAGARAAGVYKDFGTAQSVASGAAAVTLNGVAVLPGYPSTKLSGNSIVLRAGTYNLAARLQFGSTSNPTVKIMHNGSEIASNTDVTNTTTVSTSATNVVVAEGDTVAMYIASSQGENVVAGTAATYLTATPV